MLSRLTKTAALLCTVSLPQAVLADPPKENLRLVVTDSGLGGLSVVADIARRAQESNSYREVEITFVNALFRRGGGYNSLPTREEKVGIFNSALEAMKLRYEPDAILVACNTLSVLLPDCAAMHDTSIPIIGIVSTGVDMMEAELARSNDTTVLLFATQTTVEEDSHRKELLARGISAERIVLQACPELTWYIEQDPKGFDTELLISTFVGEALAKRRSTDGPVAISFNCTHFGYSASLFEDEIEAQGVRRSATLNPNDRMADFLFPQKIANRFDATEVSVQTASMVEIDPQTVEALSPVLMETSPQVGEALRNWELVPDLFNWQHVLVESE